MPFVKLDQGILDSTLWVDRDSREVFITSLLLAEPRELRNPTPQIEVRSLSMTGFVVPPGWYGMVNAAGVGIIRRALVDTEAVLAALERLCAPDPESRSADFDGRRLARVDGGYVVLNYIKYRERDYTGAERAQRYRERRRLLTASRRDSTPSRRDITQAEVEVEVEGKTKTPHVARAARSEGFESFWTEWPSNDRKGAKAKCLAAWQRMNCDAITARILEHVRSMKASDGWIRGFIPAPLTYLNQARWDGAESASTPGGMTVL